MPVTPGICTSLITQSASLMRSDWRNASAEPNAAAAYPKDRTKLAVARRKDSSSSTIAIIGTFGKIASSLLDLGGIAGGSHCPEDQGLPIGRRNDITPRYRVHYDLGRRMPNASAIRTSSAKDLAPILRVTLPRWTLTVIS